MTKAIFIHETGEPGVLKWEDFEPGEPGAGEALIRHEAIGLNFIDIYHRNGNYPLPKLPAIIGMEGAGIVEQTGPEVRDFKPGDRIAYAGLPPGAYAQKRTIPAHRLVKLPESIPTRQAAGMMLRGMTVRYLLHGCYPVKAGDTILIHAAAGGIGLIVCQWAKHLGARVIGTVGSEEKAQLAKSHGCDHAILYKEQDFVKEVRNVTDGKGVDAVYDGVGKSTFLPSLDCIRPMGTMVAFGHSSGDRPLFDPSLLSAKGSLFLTVPSLMAYTEKREDLLAHARDLFDVVEKGAVKIEVRQTYPLSEAARAHREVESRMTTGSSIFLPE